MPQLSSLEFLSSLHKCRTDRNFTLALQLHDACMSQSELLEGNPSLGNHLVSVLVEFGSMVQAQELFDRLTCPDQCAWNSLVTGYVKHGESKHALALYKKMQEDCTLYLSRFTFVALLKACGTLNEYEVGTTLHEQITKSALLERDVFVGSALVDMYIKFGLIEKAQEVFDKLLVQDVVSWTLLISGYADNGHGGKAFHYFEQMQLSGTSPDAFTLVCMSRVCGSLGAKGKGWEIHALITKMGIETELLVSNTLVDMYAKCGLLQTAAYVFEELKFRDVISWNALITGYAEQGCGDKAISLYDQMQCEGVCKDTVTFVCSLKACCVVEDGIKGREIHAEVVKSGLETELLVSSTLVNMYAKSGLLAEAKDVFDTLPAPNVVLCNALLSGYVEHGYGDEALNCFEEVQHRNIPLSAITYIFSLKACIGTGGTIHGQKIHDKVVRKGIENELLVGSTLVDMYAKCGLVEEAQEVFDKLPVQDVVSWTALMAGYAEHGHNLEVLNCYEQMQEEHVSLNAVTYGCILKACGNLGATEKGLKAHSEIAGNGLESEPLVGNTLVEMYAKCSLLMTAEVVLEKLPTQDLISCNALILGYLEHGFGERALEWLGRFQARNIHVNHVTLLGGSKAAGSIGATVKGQALHAEIVKRGSEEEPLVGNTLIDMYAKCGLLMESQALLESLPVRDVTSWTSLMSGYAQLGESETVFYMFDTMIEEGMVPNQVTFVSILNACSHGGLLSKGEVYFGAINSHYELVPTIDHYTCIVDLLGRAGRVDKALVMMVDMPVHPDSTVWQKVLGACRKWGNVGLARQAFEHAVRLDARGTAAYIYISNIFADTAINGHAHEWTTWSI